MKYALLLCGVASSFNGLHYERNTIAAPIYFIGGVIIIGIAGIIHTIENKKQ